MANPIDKGVELAETPFGAIINPYTFLVAETTPKEAYVPALIITGSAVFGIAGAIGGVVIGTLIGRRKPDMPQQAAQMQQVIPDPVSSWRSIYGQMRAGGIITFMEVTDRNSVLHQVVTIAAHEVEELGDIYINDELATLDEDGVVQTPAQWRNLITVEKSLGDEAEGVQPFQNLVDASDGLWTASHTQTGHAKLYVKFRANQKAFSRGMPRVTCLVKGKKVRDPRYSPVETRWSANAALCAADYLCSDTGLQAVYSSEIDESGLVTAANACDQQVALASGSPIEYENRYEANGIITSDRTPREVIEDFNTAMAGHALFLGGRWTLKAGVYPTPEVTALTADNLRSGIKISPRLTRRDLCNGVKGLYLSPDNFWQPSDFPPVTNSTYLSEDQGERIWRDIALQFTTSASAAQRISKISLERTRQQITVNWPGTLGCYRLQPGDVVPVTLTKYGWTSKAFEVISSTLSVDDAGRMGCDLILRETASSVYTWNAEETTVDQAPDTNLPDHLQPSDVTGATVTQQASSCIFNCDPVEDADFDCVEVRYGAQGIIDSLGSIEAAWDATTPIVRILRGNTSTSAAIPPGDWTFLFKARDRAGNYSDAAATYDLTITDDGSTAISDVQQATGWVQLHTPDYAVSTGATGYVQASSSDDFDLGSGDFSLRIKAGPTDFSSIRPLFTFQFGTTVKYAYLYFDTDGKLYIDFVSDALNYFFTAGGAVWTAGTEYDIAITCDRDGVMTVYQDGAAVGTVDISSGAGTINTTIDRVWIGRQGHPATPKNFLGTLRDASIYNRVLGADEVLSLFNGEDITSGCIGRWRMNEGTGVTATDSSSNANNGTLTGSATWVGMPTSATFLVHWTGVLVVESTKAASAHTITELFEQYVPYPVDVAICPALEVDKSIDATARIRAVVTTRAGRDRTDGDVAPQFQVDYKLSTGSYDGFEDWTLGSAEFRYMKSQIVLDTSMGIPVITGFEVIVDAQPRTEELGSVTVGSSGTAFLFGTPFHNTPTIQITPVSSSALIGTVEAPSNVGGTAHLFNTAGTGVAGTAHISAQGV